MSQVRTIKHPKARHEDLNELVYLQALEKVRDKGVDLPDRTGTGRRSIFHLNMSFNLADGGFPILTSKKVWYRGIVNELLWFLNGRDDLEWLQQRGVRFWDEWAKDDGTFGPIYGPQLRGTHNGVDQLDAVLTSLKQNPFSRRHVISLWNPADLGEMALPPCHGIVIQFFTDGTVLDCTMYQRSADMFLGVPFNIASYATLMAIVGAHTDLEPRKLNIVLGDAHVYHNHFHAVHKQLERKGVLRGAPAMRMTVRDNIEDYTDADFQLVSYKHHPSIEAPIAV